jgi:serine/threonine protein kinase
MVVDAARAKSLFLAASDLDDAAERAAYLDRECGGDAELRARVEALLWANDAVPLAPSPLSPAGERGRGEGATVDSAPVLPETEDYGDPTARVGAILAGKYKLVEEIGEGGMGSVFLAQQTEPVKRAVAVKVIKAGMDSKAVLARFEAERQALAMMDHPHIAKVLDAGTTDGGRPFFVMELVKGTPITRYCDEHKLTPRQRLELFVHVCQAIQHAHQKGVIHRDIKPSNVLVALYDDRPVPQVIDFGVVKAAGQALTDKTLMTGFGAVVGTPEYMSPEQASLNNLDIDTRSDVYSLGVLLYELLTGTTPVDKKSLGKAALLEILRIVREVEAPRPSAKLSTLDTLPSVAANRGTEPARLSKLMRGELDWLVLKALEKDRTRRYETANGLARDIQRYLADEVVEARPPSVGYRVSKVVRRHKGQVIAASVVLLALVGGVIGTTAGLFEARRQAEIARGKEREANEEKHKALQAAEEEWRAKEREAERAEGERKAKLEADVRRKEAERNLAFAILGSLLAGLDPKQIAESGRPLQDVLRQNLSKAVKELEGSTIEPLQVAAMQDTLGRSLLDLREASLAIEVLNKALATRKAKLGADHPDTLISMYTLAVAYRQSGQVAKAVPLFEETLEKTKAKFSPDHPDTLRTMGSLALAYQDNGQLAKAVTLLEETLQKQKAMFGPDHPETLPTMSSLALAYTHNGQLAKAVPLYEETLEKMKAKLGPDHPETLTTMDNLAEAYKQSGQLAKAVTLREEALEKCKAKLGPDHPDTLRTMGNLASAYEASGQLAKALPLYEETLQKEKARLGPDHPHTLASMNNLAVAYSASGQLAKAVPLMEEMLEKQKAVLGPDHPNTLLGMNNLATAYNASGQLAKAVTLFEESLQKYKAKFGSEDPRTLGTMATLSLDLLQQEKWADAEPVLRDCLAGRQKQIPDSWTTFNAQSMLGGALLGQKKYAEAEPLLVKGYEGMKTREKTIPKTGGGELRILEALDRLIELYTAINKPDEAKKWRAERAKYRQGKSTTPEKK